MTNRFSDCSNIEELVHQLIGAGSMCWDQQPNGERIFDDAAAIKLANDGIEKLQHLIYGLEPKEHLLQHINIVLRLKEDGTETYKADFFDHSAQTRISWLAGLGLLEAAKDDFRDQTFDLGQYARDSD